MSSRVRIVKRGRNEALKDSQTNEREETDKLSTRGIAATVKGWIAELRQRKRARGCMFRINKMKLRITLGLGFLIASGVWNQTPSQQLREAFRKVEQAVVIVRTEQKELAPFPQQGMVSLNGLGSGVLVSSDGKVLTAAHLVQAADAIVVEFADGEVIPARVAGTAVSADVALLQLERPPLNLASAKLADSDKTEVGDEIFVVGAPYGLSHTLTAGHISGRHTLNKRTENTMAVEFLQTDAAINRGNSGSPLFSLDGEVIGIVSNMMSTSGGSQGLAFATTSNTARRLLLEQKPFWSGIAGFLVESDLARALNLPQPAGVLVQRVAEGSIAWRWGIHAGTVRANVEGEELVLGGDIILSVNDVPVAEGGGSYDAIYASISKLRPGDNLVIKIFRQGAIVKLSIPVAP